MSTEQQETSDRASALRETLIALFELDAPEPSSLQSALRRVQPEDAASILREFDDAEKIAIYRALPGDEEKRIVLEESDLPTRRKILEQLEATERASILGQMAVDDLVDQLEALPLETRNEVLATFPKSDREEVRELLSYPPDTAGGMMTTDFISIPVNVSSRDALAKIQGNLKSEVIAYIYATDHQGRLQGVASIRQILSAKPETPVQEFITTDVISVHVSTDREEVASVANRYNLPVLPVVDDDQELRGIITFDDIFDAVEEEHSEDMLRMAGTVALHPIDEPVLVGALKRLPFLIITMLGGFGVLVVKTVFENRIPPGVFLVALGVVPLLSGLAGNVGIVTATVMVRGLATGDISSRRAFRPIWRETLVGLLLGAVLAAFVSVVLRVSGNEQYSWGICQVISLGLFASVLWAAFVGALVPLICKASRFVDPAIASGPFVTMACDLSASLIFLTLVYSLL